MSLKFTDKPPNATGGPDKVSQFADALAELRENPQRWALIYTAPTVSAAGNAAASIRHGRINAAKPAGSFETAKRGLDVWARYVGGVS